jgi:hypothetical protein
MERKETSSMNEIETVKAETLPIPAQAKLIVVKDHQKAIIEAPLIEGEKWLNGQVTAYHQEQERIRAAEQEQLRQEALKAEATRRKEEEDRKTKEAAELEAAGLVDEAEALMVEAIEEKEKPVEVYVRPPETQKVKLEGARISTYWSAEVTDIKALCRAVADGKCSTTYVEANMSALNARAKSDMKELNIPGVKAVSRSSLGATGRSKAA